MRGVLLALLLCACGEAVSPPRFAEADCRRVAVTDGAGAPLTGIEDVAADGDALVLSAYDRLSPETHPAGVFRVPVEALHAAATAEPLASAPGLPHGVSVQGGSAVAVFREKSGAGFAIGGFVGGEWDLAATGDALCAANDLVPWPEADGAYAVTIDRRDCPGRSLRDALLPGGGRLVLAFGDARTTLRDGLSYPNGVAVLPSGTLAVAETRARRVRLLGADSEDTLWPVPGAPDNLTVAEDGRLVVAVQPSLIRFARYRYGRADTAPSRLVALSPGTGTLETLYDGDGAQFSGATVGALIGGRLVAGSVRDEGLLVCEAA